MDQIKSGIRHHDIFVLKNNKYLYNKLVIRRNSDEFLNRQNLIKLDPNITIFINIFSTLKNLVPKKNQDVSDASSIKS